MNEMNVRVTTPVPQLYPSSDKAAHGTQEEKKPYPRDAYSMAKLLEAVAACPPDDKTQHVETPSHEEMFATAGFYKTKTQASGK